MRRLVLVAVVSGCSRPLAASGSTPWPCRRCEGRQPDSGVRRAVFQQHMESHGVDTRMVWTGNAARQPAFKNRPHRVDVHGLPNADRIMQCGLILPCTHACSDDDMVYVCEQIDGFFKKA